MPSIKSLRKSMRQSLRKLPSKLSRRRRKLSPSRQKLSLRRKLSSLRKSPPRRPKYLHPIFGHEVNINNISKGKEVNQPVNHNDPRLYVWERKNKKPTKKPKLYNVIKPNENYILIKNLKKFAINNKGLFGTQIQHKT